MFAVEVFRRLEALIGLGSLLFRGSVGFTEILTASFLDKPDFSTTLLPEASVLRLEGCSNHRTLCTLLGGFRVRVLGFGVSNPIAPTRDF